MGRCDAYGTEFDLEAEEYVPLPKGDVHKKKEIVQVLLPCIAMCDHAAACSHVVQALSAVTIHVYVHGP